MHKVTQHCMFINSSVQITLSVHHLMSTKNMACKFKNIMRSTLMNFISILPIPILRMIMSRYAHLNTVEAILNLNNVFSAYVLGFGCFEGGEGHSASLNVWGATSPP